VKQRAEIAEDESGIESKKMASQKLIAWHQATSFTGLISENIDSSANF
jgi:hypothetical protein